MILSRCQAVLWAKKSCPNRANELETVLPMKTRITSNPIRHSALARRVSILAVALSVIAISTELESILDLGLAIAGGNVNGGGTHSTTWSDWKASEPVAEQAPATAIRQANWEGKKLYFFYDIVTAAEGRVQSWVSALQVRAADKQFSQVLSNATLIN